MSTFNAGAIEATLTLGRSTWNREVKKLKKEIEDLEKTSITIGIDADTDNAYVSMDNLKSDLDHLDAQTYSPSIDLIIRDAEEALNHLIARLDALDVRTVTVSADADIDNALVQLNNLELDMNMLERDTVKIQADADIAAAMAQLEELSAAAKVVSAETINIDADIETAGALAHLAELEAAAKLVDAETISIDVDVDRNALESLVGDAAGGGGGGGGSLGLLKILLLALLILSPLVAAATGALTAAIIGFAAAVSGAGGPLLVLVGGLALLYTQYQKLQKAGKPLTPQMKEMAKTMHALAKARDEFMKEIGDAGFGLIAQGAHLLELILPTIAPLFNATAGAISGVLTEIQSFVQSSEYKEMLGFFGGFGLDMLTTFLHIGGNLLQFFGRLFAAIAPFASRMMHGLEETTAGWAEWAGNLEHNQSFQHFVQNAEKYGPQILHLLGSIIQAFIAVGHALEPFAGPMITGLTAFFEFIANMNPDQLTILIGVGAALWGIVQVVQFAIPLFEGLSAAIGVVTAALGLPLLPLLLIVGAVAAVAYALYQAWQSNEQFRDIVIKVWNEIKQTVSPIVEAFSKLIKDNWSGIRDWALQVWGDISGTISDFAIIAMQIIRGVLFVIRTLWAQFGSWILDDAKGVFMILGAIIGAGWKIIHGIFQIVRGILTGDMGAIKDGLMSIVHGFIGLLTGVWGGIKTILQRPFNNIKDFVATQIGKVITFLSGVGTKINTAAAGMWDGIKAAFRSAINWIIRGWNSLKFSIPGIDPPGPGPKIPGFTIGVPQIPQLATGGIINDATLALIGEGKESEIVAPDSKMEAMARRAAAGSQLDYNQLAAIMMAAVQRVLDKFSGISAADMERLIQSAGANIDITMGGGDAAVTRLAALLGFEMRRLGYGGKANV